LVKSEPKKKPQPGGFFQKFFRKPERNEKEQRLTVQRSIPYLEMGRDGICRVEEHLYSKTVRFYDINYQLAQNEDKNTIFESWCDFLNYFDASIRFQLSFINHKSDMSEYNKVIQIEPQHDAFDDVRMEYAQMLKQQLAKGNNGLVRTKYITFSIEAKSVREAKPRLERIETDILNNFKVLGVKAYPLNGVERLQIMYETFHQEEQQKFDFSYDRILQSGMTTKDFIAPTSFLFKSGKQAAAATNTITEKAKAAVQEIVLQNKTLWVGIGVGILLVMVMLGAFSSCGAAIQGTGSTFVGTTYPSKDADMKGAEEDYLELEKELDKQIRQMESTHPGYDEYRYQLDEIGHDPYQLISHLTAVYEQFTRGQVKPVIKELFKQQYLLKVWETIEIRTRMETRVGVRPTIDAFGNVSMETYTYQEEVEYEYKILNVLLKNKGFDTIARKNMNQKQTGRYDAYNMTYGNRPELFGAGSPTYSGGTTGSIGTGGGSVGSGGGFKYDIPSEALSDEKFAKMITEAEKYLGMPYVWGGSSPSTSFDCSGFVCWVINNSGNGWSVGRTTANGLRGKCSYVSPADAQPGDLIFFEKTYNTAGASHVGIYVGDGMMIHCGDPISYTSINSTYWQSHFLGFGRIN